MQKRKVKKITVLLSAYSCGPNHGSEPEVGWQSAIHLSKYCNTKVLTTSIFKESIEKEINSLDIKNIQFITKAIIKHLRADHWKINSFDQDCFF